MEGTVELPSIDDQSDRAPFRQISDHLRVLINDGSFPPNRKLPSEAELGEHYQVARGTIRQALKLLESEGLVEIRRGVGAFVRTSGGWPELSFGTPSSVGELFMDEVSIGMLQPSEVTADLIHSREPDGSIPETLALRRRYTGSGRPLELATSYLPADVAAQLSIDKEAMYAGGLNKAYAEIGRIISRSYELVSARAAKHEESKLLRLRVGTPVLQVIRVSLDSADRLVEVCESVVHSELEWLVYGTKVGTPAEAGPLIKLIPPDRS